MLANGPQGCEYLRWCGDRLVYGGPDYSVYALTLDGKLSRTGAHQDRVSGIEVLADGSAGSWADDGRVLHHCAGGEDSSRELIRHAGRVHAVRVTGAGTVISGGADGAVFHLVPGQPARPLSRHHHAVMDLLVIGDDRVVSTGSDGRMVLCSLSESRAPGVRW